MFLFDLGALPVPLLLLRGPEIGVAPAAVPIFYFIFSLAFVIFAMPFGKLSDKIGEGAVILIGLLAAISAYLSFMISFNYLILALAFVILGFHGAATDGIRRALTSKLVDPLFLATGQGFLRGAVGIAALLAGVIGGTLWQAFGSSAAFIYAAIFSAIGSVCFIYLTRQTDYKEI